MSPQAAFMLVAIALAVLGGLVDGTRHRERSQPSPIARLAMNRRWHRLQGAREVLIGLALGWAFFGGPSAALAAAAVYGAVRWVAFDEAHNVVDRRLPLYTGTVADTDGLLRRLPPGGRLALKLAAALLAATALYHAA